MSHKFVIIIVLSAILTALGFAFFYTKPEPFPTLVEPKSDGILEVIGLSVEGREIESYIYGNGAKRLLFVGGIHGGYEWNSISLAYEMMNYFKLNPEVIPHNVTVAIIPNLNPDGLEKSSAGRFNAHGVDLNRNFDCKWQSEATWQNKKVSAGTKAFSEPESLALKNFVEKYKPNAVVFWHSKANAVYASECKLGILPETLDIMNSYAKASGYQAISSFSAYPVTGDAEGWLASIGIPAITVELKTHETTEWGANLLGIKALLEYYK